MISRQTKANTITDEIYDDFEDACSKAEMDKILKMLSEYGKSIAERSGLHVAAKNGHLNVVQILLSMGITNQLLDVCQWSAMHYAAYYNKADVLACLCAQFPADIEKRTGKGLFHGNESLLHAAARGSATQALKFILDKKYFDVDVRDQNDETCLHWAMRAKAKECALLLIANGADINAKSNKNRTPFDGDSNSKSASTEQFNSEILRLARTPDELSKYVDTVQTGNRECRIM